MPLDASICTSFLACNKDFFAALASIFTLISVSVAAIGLFITARQFLAAEKWKQTEAVWKKNEFLVREIKEFLDNKDVREIIGCLDYSKRFFSFDETTARGISLTTYHRDELIDRTADGGFHVSIPQALHLHTERPIRPQEEILRDKFDQYFAALERFAVLAKANLFSYDELANHIRYHLDILNDLKPHSFGYHKALYTYLVFYDFELTLELLSHFPRSKSIKIYLATAQQSKEEYLLKSTRDRDAHLNIRT